MAKPGPGLSSWSLPPLSTDICTMTASLYLWFWKPCIPPSVSLGDDLSCLKPLTALFPTGRFTPGSKLTPLPSGAFSCSCLYLFSADRVSTQTQSPHHSNQAPTSISLTLQPLPLCSAQSSQLNLQLIPSGALGTPPHSLCSPCLMPTWLVPFAFPQAVA